MPKISTKSLRRLTGKFKPSILTGAITESADYIDELEVENDLIKDRNMNLHNSNVEYIHENEELKRKIDEKYVESLENLLISLCQSLDNRESNGTISKLPKIQGQSMDFNVMQIAELPFETPTMSISEIYEILKKTRV